MASTAPTTSASGATKTRRRACGTPKAISSRSRRAATSAIRPRPSSRSSTAAAAGRSGSSGGSVRFSQSPRTEYFEGRDSPMLALGIDRGTGSLRLALLETAGRATRLVGCWRVPVATDADPAAVLREAIAQRCPRPPDAVATALAGERVSHRILRLPFSDPGRLAATVPFELESQVPFELDDSLTTFTVLRRDPGGAAGLAAIAARDDVRSHLEELKSAGLDPAVVDVGGIATAGLVRLTLRDALV